MTENKVDQPTSLSQLLRESYLAEARAQQRHSEMSRSDSSSSRRLVYGPLKGKAEDSMGHEDPQFPDLSAFLSQEELDKSVNLARQAIGHESCTERAEAKSLPPSANSVTLPSSIPSATYPATSTATSSTTPSTTPSANPLVAPSTPFVAPSIPNASTSTPIAAHSTPIAVTSTPFAATSTLFPIPSVLPTTQPAPERKDLSLTHSTISAEKQTQQPPMQDNVVRNNRAPKDGFQDFNMSARNTPYGPETQSKKEFLNKAADFIEELSSLFKANSSKRIRPRACKAHRSRHQNKTPSEGTVFVLNTDDRERPILPQEMERPAPIFSYQPEVQEDPAEFDHAGPREFPMQDCRTTEETYDSRVMEVEEAESPVLTENSYRAESVCEPPRFIQKLKSREVPEGSKVQLDCIVRGLPMPEVRWFCEGKELENSPDIQIINNGELHSLIIAEAFEEDTGRYSCFASNFYGTDSTSAEIYIEGASSTDSEGEPRYEHETQLMSEADQLAPFVPVVSNTVVTLGVEDPAPFHLPVSPEEDQQEVPSQPSSLTTTSSLPPQTTTNVLPVLEVATAPPNPVGSAPTDDQEVTTPIPVQVVPAPSSTDSESTLEQDESRALAVSATSIPPPVLTSTILPLTQLVSTVLPIQVAPTQITLPESQNFTEKYPQGLDGRPIMAAPVFTKSLQDLLSLEGQLVVLECRVKGVPSPKVNWYRDGINIEDSPDFRILQKKPRSMAESEEICTLVIAEVFPEDSGTFTCTASNNYGTVSSIAALKVKGNDSENNYGNGQSHLNVKSSQITESSTSELPKPRSEAPVTNNSKPHSSTIRLDTLSSSTLRLDPLSTSTLRLDPHSSSMLRQEPLCTSLPNLDPLNLNSPRLDHLFLSTLHQDLPGSTMMRPDTQNTNEGPSFYKPFTGQLMSESQSTSLKNGSEDSRPEAATGASPKMEGAVNHQKVTPTVVPLPDPPTSSCLKSGVLVNHNEPRSSSRVGLRVHFKLPEDEEDENSDTSSSQSYEDMAQASANKEPPPVLAKPKLDPVQLQLLHNQVLMEQQQEGEPSSQKESSNVPGKTHHHLHSQTKPQVQVQPQADPQVQVQVQLQPQQQVQPKIQPQLQTQPQSQPQFQPQHQPQAQTQFQPQFQPPSQPQPQPQPQFQPQSQAQSQPQPQAQFQPKAQFQPQPQPQPQPQSQPQPQPQLHFQPQSQPQSQPQNQFQPQPQTQAQAQYQPQSQPEPSRLLPPTPIFMQTSQSHVFTTASTAVLNSIPLTRLNTTPTAQVSTTPAPLPSTTFAPSLNSAPASTKSTLPSPPQLKIAPTSLMTSPSLPPQLRTAPGQYMNTAHSTLSFSTTSVTQMNTIHASHLNLGPSSMPMTPPTPQFSSPPAPHPSTGPRASLSSIPASLSKAPTSHQNTSPSPMLRSAHASLMNLAPTSQTFNYARPKEFITAQNLSPVRSPSPTESPVPLLHELAAQLQSSTANSPPSTPFYPPPRVFPTRVLTSPTSPPTFVSSPPLVPAAFLNSVFALRPQSPPQASSPTSSSSTPSPIQNPVAFLSSVLPSLPTSQLTNSMGLPRSAPTGPPQGILKRVPRTRLLSDEEIRDSKENLLHDIEKKLRFKDGASHFVQKPTYEGKTTSRPLGPNIPATVFNYDEEYKVSNFEQRLMSEIEFRLERTPVEESDDEVQHDEIPTGKCIAPIFDKKLKNYRAMEGVPVTLSCKVVGIPIPKVYWFKDGMQILRKNDHYKKIREGDGTCALHIESTTNDDDGNYTVMAANPQGRISCSGHLIVQTGPLRNRLTPMIHSQRVRARVQEVEEGEQTQERFFRPHFLQAPGDMLAHEGKLCRLDCKVSGLPNPELMWLVNGKPIYPDFYHRMLVRENGVHSLVMDPLTQNDAGTYTCIASNKAGQSSFCLELKVVEKEMKYPPQFIEKLQNTGIAEGAPVRLECRVVGMPPPVIFWKKDNDTIPHTKDRVNLHQDATGYVCLLIQPTRKEDAGWYTVSAKNETGIVSCTARLDIYAQWHQQVPMPMKKAPRPGSRYAALTGQGLDIRSAFPTSDNSPILFSSSPVEAKLESEEL